MTAEEARPVRSGLLLVVRRASQLEPRDEPWLTQKYQREPEPDDWDAGNWARTREDDRNVRNQVRIIPILTCILLPQEWQACNLFLYGLTAGSSLGPLASHATIEMLSLPPLEEAQMRR